MLTYIALEQRTNISDSLCFMVLSNKGSQKNYNVRLRYNGTITHFTFSSQLKSFHVMLKCLELAI